MRYTVRATKTGCVIGYLDLEVSEDARFVSFPVVTNEGFGQLTLEVDRERGELLVERAGKLPRIPGFEPL